MLEQRWREVEALYHSACELQPQERRAFLDNACGSDGALRHEVESLLANEQLAVAFLETHSPDLVGRELEAHIPPGTRIGPYVVLEFLRAGGMGEVYKARDTRLERTVAIKFLPRALGSESVALHRFEREARSASALNHPHICTLHDVGDYEGRLFLVMEFLKGESLKDRIAGKPRPLRELLNIAVQTADGIQAAHAEGIVHRDVKPGNIFISGGGQVKILDFGLAKRTGEAGTLAANPTAAISTFQTVATTGMTATGPGSITGTLAYLSPEQARGKEVDARTDIYSFGVVLYEMATGRPTFRRETAADLIEAILNEAPVRPSQLARVPAGLERIILRALEKQREKRYQSVAELLAELRKLQQREARRSRKAALLLACAATVIVAAGATLVWLRASSTAYFDPMEMTQVTRTGSVLASAVSPDGKFLAYATGDKPPKLRLRRLATDADIDLGPVPPQVHFFGLTFSPDESYIYYVNTGVPPYVTDLFRVSVLGGPPRRIVQNVDSRVVFSPDGSQIAFVRMNVRPGEDALIIANFDGGEAHTVATWKGSERLHSLGLSWSRDGKLIAIPVTEATHDYLAIVSADGRSRRILSQGKWRHTDSVTWLRDNLHLVVAAESPPSTVLQIWEVSADNGEPRRITNDLSDYQELTTTKDGTVLSATRSMRNSNLWVGTAIRSASGDIRVNLRALTEGTGALGITGLAWVGNKRVAYTLYGDRGEDISVTDDDGRNTRKLIRGRFVRGGFCACSDRYVVFASDSGDLPDIWRVDIDGSNEKLLARNAEAPSCSPDGTWVSFISLANGHKPFRVGTQGGTPVELLKHYVSTQEFSPDSSRLMYQIETGLAIGALDDGEPSRNINAGSLGPMLGARVVHWAPKSEGFDFVNDQNGANSLFRLRPDARKPIALAHVDSGIIWNFAWSPDGTKLALANGDVSSDVVLIRKANASNRP